MQTIEPTEHLRRKLALLDERSVRRWPRWENDDYIAVAFLLDDVAARIEELERQLQSERVEQSHVLEVAMAQAIKLEQQLREARETAQAQSETVQRDWLSPAEAEGLRRQLETERRARVLLTSRCTQHITDMLDYWKQEAAQ